MTDLERSALLPAGLRDVLPPVAGYEAEAIERLVAHFAGHGYARVKAPLVEFEEGLLSGAGAAMSGHTFRLMDPVSQRMMGVRADITPQIARIASTRLKAAPRPLRLSYSGEVLRITGSQLRPERQFAQVGVELIGCEAAAADAEVIVMAAESLAALGLSEISIDLSMPPLVPALMDALGITGEVRERLRAALDRKDAAAVAELGDRAATTLGALLAAAGPAEDCFAVVDGIDLPVAAARERARVGEVLRRVREAAPDLALTFDPVENRGFEYHTGVSFTVFPTGTRGELGAGGRYVSAINGAAATDGEAATGFTLYVDTILRALPVPPARDSVFLPAGTSPAAGLALRDDGWATVSGLEAVDEDAAEARRLGCSHVLDDDGIRPLEDGGE